MMSKETGTPPRLIVLGGGLAGLSVARAALKERPCRVTVLEKAARPGGMAVSLQIHGITADLGPHRIYSTIPEMRQWFKDLLGERLFVVRRTSRMFVDGQFLGYPPNPFELARRLGPGAMTRFACGYLGAKYRALMGGLAPNSFAAVMERSFGRPLCETLVFPYIRKVWKLEPEGVSADAARARATMGGLGTILRRLLGPAEKPGSESTLKQFHYVRGGIEGMAKQLADEIRDLGGEIVCNADVRSLALDKNQVTRAEYQSLAGDDSQHFVQGDFVFSTLPLPDLVRSLSDGGLQGTGIEVAAKGLRFLKSILVYAVLRRPSLSADHWLYFPQSEPRINRVYEPKNFDASLGQKDQTMICIEGTALDGDEEWGLEDTELARRYIERLASTGILSPGEVLASHVHRLEDAYPIYDLDYSEKLQRIWKALRGIENLIPLGRQGLFQHNNMDHTIFTGLRAARCWAKSERPIDIWYDREIPKFQKFRIVD